MKNRPSRDNAPRVVGTTLVLWGAGVALAAAEGVFAKLSPQALAALVIFTLAYAASLYAFDRSVRGMADRLRTRTLVSTALALDAAVAAALLAMARAAAPFLERLAQFPFAVAALFVAPLALVATLAALGRARRARLSSAQATSPGARPAAT